MEVEKRLRGGCRRFGEEVGRGWKSMGGCKKSRGGCPWTFDCYGGFEAHLQNHIVLCNVEVLTLLDKALHVPAGGTHQLPHL